MQIWGATSCQTLLSWLRVEDAMNGLGRGRKVSTLGEGERIIKEVEAIEELKLRGVEGDAVVVGDSFVL